MARRKKFQGSDKTFWKIAAELALQYVNPIIPCADCGYPVVKGYVCQFCGSENPEGYK
jgi:hypothetical protein